MQYTFYFLALLGYGYVISTLFHYFSQTCQNKPLSFKLIPFYALGILRTITIFPLIIDSIEAPRYEWQKKREKELRKIYERERADRLAAIKRGEITPTPADLDEYRGQL